MIFQRQEARQCRLHDDRIADDDIGAGAANLLLAVHAAAARRIVPLKDGRSNPTSALPSGPTLTNAGK